MQIRQECPACKRTLQVGRYGKFFFHYVEGKGKVKLGACIGSNHTVNEVKEKLENAAA